jgi:hypothetical protein
MVLKRLCNRLGTVAMESSLGLGYKSAEGIRAMNTFRRVGLGLAGVLTGMFVIVFGGAFLLGESADPSPPRLAPYVTVEFEGPTPRTLDEWMVRIDTAMSIPNISPLQLERLATYCYQAHVHCEDEMMLRGFLVNNEGRMQFWDTYPDGAERLENYPWSGNRYLRSKADQADD